MIYQPNYFKNCWKHLFVFSKFIMQNTSKTRTTLEFLINQASKELVQKNMGRTKCDIRRNRISPTNILEIPREAISTYNGFKKNFQYSKNLFNNNYIRK